MHPAVGNSWSLDLGACVLDGGKITEFNVWAPNSGIVDLLLLGEDGNKTTLKMQKRVDGYFNASADAKEGMRYFYLLDQNRRADPASRFQPEGVHGPSQVVDLAKFEWSDSGWRGVAVQDLIIYEIHVGTYTKEGTFDSMIPHLDYLKNTLGVTAIEIMPVSQFPGERNWGYDGVFMYAPQNSYGGPESLMRLVDSAHQEGLAVILDVVYNHVGPEGNYLQDFAPYFSYKYHTPWGPAFNYDDRGCDNVRKYVIDNATYWIRDFHFDGLRLDAIHGIFDNSPKHILEEIKDSIVERTRELGRKINIIAESDLNDPKIVLSKEKCGYGLDSQWSDDFHHSVHAFLTKEKFGYYEDYGSLEDIAKSLRDGFVYDGRYSKFRGKKHGGPSKDITGEKFVICLQNHDQVGNRWDGSRLATLLKDRRALKVAAGLLLLSPYVPLLFMGEEFGDISPFYYFISHSDARLVEAVREGRKKELGGGHFIDPQDPQTFFDSKVKHELRVSNKELLSYYAQLIELRKSQPALGNLDRRNVKVRFETKENIIVIHRIDSSEALSLVFNLGQDQSNFHLDEGIWRKIHDSNEGTNLQAETLKANQEGIIPPLTLAIYARQRD